MIILSLSKFDSNGSGFKYSSDYFLIYLDHKTVSSLPQFYQSRYFNDILRWLIYTCLFINVFILSKMVSRSNCFDEPIYHENIFFVRRHQTVDDVRLQKGICRIINLKIQRKQKKKEAPRIPLIMFESEILNRKIKKSNIFARRK